MMDALDHKLLIRNEDLEMKLPENLQIKNINFMSFKTLMVVVFIYPILPLALFSTVLLFYGFGSLVSIGLQHSSVNQLVLQFLLFSGGTSGLFGGIMVLFNRVNATSLVLFLHGAISYSFVAVTFISYTKVSDVMWLLHSTYLVFTLVVIVVQLYLIVKKVVADYQAAKVANTTLSKAAEEF